MCELVIWRDSKGDTLWFWLAYGCRHLNDELSAWLKFHGIDPDTVTNPGMVDRDVIGCAVTVTADDGTGHAVTRRYQGETPPRELPPSVLGYTLAKHNMSRRPPVRAVDGSPLLSTLGGVPYPPYRDPF